MLQSGPTQTCSFPSSMKPWRPGWRPTNQPEFLNFPKHHHLLFTLEITHQAPRKIITRRAESSVSGKPFTTARLGNRNKHQEPATSRRGRSLRGLAMSAVADSHIQGCCDPILRFDVAQCGISQIPQHPSPHCRVLTCQGWSWSPVR